MSNLARLQWDFQEFLLHEAGTVETHIAAAAHAPMATRLGLYAEAYRVRLFAALESNTSAIVHSQHARSTSKGTGL